MDQDVAKRFDSLDKSIKQNLDVLNADHKTILDKIKQNLDVLNADHKTILDRLKGIEKLVKSKK